MDLLEQAIGGTHSNYVADADVNVDVLENMQKQISILSQGVAALLGQTGPTPPPPGPAGPGDAGVGGYPDPSAAGQQAPAAPAPAPVPAQAY
jgi:hypothetical protein